MIIYTNTRSKKSKKQRQKQKAAWVKQQKALGAEPVKQKKFIVLSRPDNHCVLRTGAEQYKSIRSVETTATDTFKRESVKYTGAAMIGIATLHKSNAVPVFSQQDAHDISKMRR